MNKMRNIVLAFIAVIAAFACSTSGGKGEMDQATKVKFDQYVVQGKSLYSTYCIQCHQQNGEGLAQLYPPLAKSDYLMENFARAACIVKNGQTQEIVVNGVTYNQVMPGLTQLTNLEIAEILTYITNSWGNEGGIQEVSSVEKWLADCEE